MILADTAEAQVMVSKNQQPGPAETAAEAGNDYC